jgi:hypothetical protein
LTIANRVGGISIASAYAVLRLVTNWNFVGCSIGKSAGLAPFNILFLKDYHFATGRGVKNGKKSALHSGQADVAVGSKTEVVAQLRDFCFAPSNGHRQPGHACPKGPTDDITLAASCGVIITPE